MNPSTSRVCMVPARLAESEKAFKSLPSRKQRALYEIALNRLKWFPERSQEAGFWLHLSTGQVALLGRAAK